MILFTVAVHRLLLTLLEHFVRFQTGDAELIAHTLFDADKPLLDQLVAGGRYGEELFQYLTVVIGVCNDDSHAIDFYWFVFLRISAMRFSHALPSVPPPAPPSISTIRAPDLRRANCAL